VRRLIACLDRVLSIVDDVLEAVGVLPRDKR
jgi:hypothetical protein